MTVAHTDSTVSAQVKPGLAVAAWWLFVLRYEARELWRSLPGPWWVKVALIVITQAIPGPQDEILLLAVVAWCRKRKARQS